MRRLVMLGLVLVAAPRVAAAQAAYPGVPETGDDYLRWPLTSSDHPELSPRFDVATLLARPGVQWMELCQLGAHKRVAPALREQTAYLGAWCAIANREIDTAIVALRPLLRATTRRLPDAVRMDLANILANEGDADAARALIAKHQLHDLGIQDRLAALFADMGKLDQAREINDLALGATSPPLDACRRRARRIALDPAAYRSPLLATDRFVGAHPSCRSLELELACWLLPEKHCGPYFRAKGDTVRASLFTGLATWTPRNDDDLRRAMAALDTATDIAVAISVLGALEKRGDCADEPWRWGVAALARELLAHPKSERAQREQLDKLVDALAAPKGCP